MLRRELSSKLWSVFSCRWSVFVGYTETIKPNARLYGCRGFIRGGRTQFGVRPERFSHPEVRRHLGSSSERDSASGNVAEKTELQQLAEEKRLLIQKKKEAKRAERIEQQRQWLEKKVTMLYGHITSAVSTL